MRANRIDSRGRNGFRAIACAASLAFTLVFFAAPASAATGETWLPLFDFDGSDATAGAFSTLPGSIAVHQPTGTVYVVDRKKGVIDKFNAAGEAQSFSATGESSLDPYPGIGEFHNGHGIAVDSYGPNPGRIYVISHGQHVRAFEPSGELAWELDAGPYIEDVSVATDGRLFLANDTADILQSQVDVYASSGSPPAKVGGTGVSHFIDFLDVSADGIIYYGWQGRLQRVEGEKEKLLTDSGFPLAYYVAVDQSSPDGHVFATGSSGDYFTPNGFTEYDSEGNVLGEGLGKEAITAINGRIDYDAPQERVYVSVDGKVIVFGKAIVTTPDLTLDPVSGITTTSADFSGTVSPLGVNSSYHFEWKKASQAWSEASKSPEETLPANEEVHQIAYEATGLAAKSTYNVRLVATNTDVGVKVFSAERTFSNVAVEVRTIAAAPRTDTTARLNAMVEPSSNPATVHFELSEDDGETWTTLEDHQVEEGQAGAMAVGHELSGLEPDTTYLYRAFAESELGEASPQGEEVELRTRTSAEMDIPERGIELVNSPDKGNQNVFSDRMSADGNRVVWAIAGSAPGGTNPKGNTFLAQRGAGGWHSQSLIPPAAEQVGTGEFQYFRQASNTALSSFVFSAGASFNGEKTYLRIDDAGNQKVLGSLVETAGLQFTMTDDGERALVVDNDQHQLLEMSGEADEVISLMPDGTPSACGLNVEGRSFPGVLWREGYQAMASADASRAYFTAPPNGKCAALPALFVRNRETETTTQIDPGTSGRAPEFIRATPDGRSAFFATPSKLDPADENKGVDVYRWDEEAGESSCLTCVVANADLSRDGGIPNDVLVSDDFSHVYFESTRQLVPGQGKTGDLNLYVLDEGEVRFVAYISDKDGALTESRAKLSADGNVLALRTPANPSLSADPIAPQCKQFPDSPPASCEQLYLYDDRDRSIECLSCRHGALTTEGNRSTESTFEISADGSTVAFSAEEDLLPLDVNHGLDLYEWRNGVTRLITDGVTDFQGGDAAPTVWEIDADGKSVLFSVVAPGLTGFEHDRLANLYMARIGGGFPVPPPPTHCEGDSCQGPLQAPPPVPRTASSGFSGNGNVPPQSRKRRPCAKKKGKAKRRCIRRHKRRAAQRAKRAHENGRASR